MPSPERFQNLQRSKSSSSIGGDSDYLENASQNILSTPSNISNIFLVLNSVNFIASPSIVCQQLKGTPETNTNCSIDLTPTSTHECIGPSHKNSKRCLSQIFLNDAQPSTSSNSIGIFDNREQELASPFDGNDFDETLQRNSNCSSVLSDKTIIGNSSMTYRPAHQSPGPQSPPCHSFGNESPVHQSPVRCSPAHQSSDQSSAHQTLVNHIPEQYTPNHQSPDPQRSARHSLDGESLVHQSPVRRSSAHQSPDQSPVHQTPAHHSPEQYSPSHQCPNPQTPACHSIDNESPFHQSPVRRSPAHQSPDYSPHQTLAHHSLEQYTPSHQSPDLQSPIHHSLDNDGQSEGDSVHANIERELKNRVVYTPDQMYAIIMNAKVNGEKYNVKEMLQKEFYNIKELINNKNWVKNEVGQKVSWTQIKEVRVACSQPSILQYKNDFDSGYSLMNIEPVQKTKSKRGTKTNSSSLVNPNPASDFEHATQNILRTPSTISNISLILNAADFIASPSPSVGGNNKICTSDLTPTSKHALNESSLQRSSKRCLNQIFQNCNQPSTFDAYEGFKHKEQTRTLDATDLDETLQPENNTESILTDETMISNESTTTIQSQPIIINNKIMKVSVSSAEPSILKYKF